MKQALGLIEIKGLATAILVADTMAKTANVRIEQIENTKGLGWMTIKVVGDVGAVNAAVKAGELVGSANQFFISSKVIPRPSDSVEAVFCQSTKEEIKDIDKNSKKEEIIEINKENNEVLEKEQNIIENEIKQSELNEFNSEEAEEEIQKNEAEAEEEKEVNNSPELKENNEQSNNKKQKSRGRRKKENIENPENQNPQKQ